MKPIITTGRVPEPCEDFSLVLGGPLYQLFLRTRLSRPALELLHRRIIALVLIAWVPLLILSALKGQAIGGVEVPLLHDIAANARFLLALPLMIGAELLAHTRLRAIVEQFRDRALVAPQDHAKFEQAVQSALRWRNSIAAEVVMLVLSLTLGYWVWSKAGALNVPTWYGYTDAAGDRHTTAAGFWSALVSLPLFRFILLRWYFRIVIWYRFMWTVSQLDLQLNTLHPDRCGGLGFLSGSIAAFQPLLIAQSVLAAGIMGDRIWHEGLTLPQFEMEIGLLVVAFVVVVLVPLCFFSGPLARARRTGVREYGLLASKYVDDFKAKWIAPASATASTATAGEPMLGSADIQSLADLGSSFAVVTEMRSLPFGKSTLIQLVVAILLPIAPLVLTMIPLNELIVRLLQLVT